MMKNLRSDKTGNYLGILELLAKFDPFLAQHTQKYAGAGKGSTSYLSKTICEKLMKMMAKQLLMEIVSVIKQAKYFSTSVDSTPDISHVDQLTFTVRYVGSHGRPIERFINFVEVHSHKAENFANVVKDVITENLDISNLRRQSYDNASNMAGAYSGLQARIEELNKLAHFVPCAAHSINLVGASSTDSCLDAITFFNFLQNLYTFFSSSTHRWDCLVQAIEKGGLVVKSLSNTRWRARDDAVKAVRNHYCETTNPLLKISKDRTQTMTTRAEEGGLIKQMESFETALMTVIWITILERFNVTNIALQSPTIDLLTVANLYKFLLTFVQN
ncbi:zinc finger MYM-type protein 1-like [Limulus polyphemus]|uniref:Zinc finger MYM-type protein 1-like n=1 Tax=Limulus polyphemus TaxID=6850 RepID=A0ABM1BHS1_LIMPO|nr:zinc finger MYM-type protein 1-like [Limulus polyphemus]